MGRTRRWPRRSSPSGSVRAEIPPASSMDPERRLRTIFAIDDDVKRFPARVCITFGWQRSARLVRSLFAASLRRLAATSRSRARRTRPCRGQFCSVWPWITRISRVSRYTRRIGANLRDDGLHSRPIESTLGYHFKRPSGIILILATVSKGTESPLFSDEHGYAGASTFSPFSASFAKLPLSSGARGLECLCRAEAHSH